jgi:phage replication initiation protein
MAESKYEDVEGEAPNARAQPRVGAAASDPPQVIRGESYWQGTDQDTGERLLVPVQASKGRLQFLAMPFADTQRYSAITDWLNFTFPMESCGGRVEVVVQAVLALLGPKAAPAEQRAGGRHHYDRAIDLGDSGGLICYGGNRNTCLVSFSGETCSLVDDWNAVIDLGRDRLNGRVTRWDGAVDDYAGAHTVDMALRCWDDGMFGSGGKQPQMRQNGNWTEGSDGRGRTIYIGHRDNGKCLRVYEKGMQLGAKWHPWVRWELQYGSEGRILPWEVLTSPGPYMVGAYPKALSWIQKEASRVRTIQKQEQISYEALTAHAKRQYGPFIDTMLKVEGSPEKVVEKLRKEGTPKRLRHPFIDRPEEWLE